MIFEKQVVNGYKAMMHTRYDNTELSFYFSHKDFEGFEREEYAFNSSMGHTLQGYLYYYKDFNEDRLIVFDHGLGNGHRAYMREIEKLCSHGYRVFAYDHTGCMESEGAGAGGFAQSLCDLDDCLKALKTDAAVDTTDISVMGHSWGGFSTINIAALHPDVKRIVVLSGPVSVERMIGQLFAGLLSGYRKAILALEMACNPDYVKLDAAETLKTAEAKALLIYSDDDAIVKKAAHYDVLKEALDGKENITLMLVEGKAHNPNYTKDAVSYLATLSKAMKRPPKTEEEKAAFKASFDWNRMTAQDEALWSEILAFLKV
jgi:pimeloyl-ACP methyl ester carboxylesterase